MVLPHVALDWLWHCLSVFSWFILMLHCIDCNSVYLCLMVLPHVALDRLWHCLSISYCSSSSCIGLIVTLVFFVLMVLPHVALDSLLHFFSLFLWFFLILHLIDCDIVFLCSYGSTSCCIELIVVLFLCVLKVLPHVALDWLWHCLSVFLWFFLMLHWIDCDIVYLCFHGSSSCCLGLIVISFFCVFMVLRHVAFDLLWHCLSLFSWFFLMLHWIDCGIVYLCSHGSSSCCIGLIVTVFICVLMGLPYVAFDWVWHCLSVFSWFFLMLHWIYCGIVYMCSHGSVSCCSLLIVTLFVCVLMVLPHAALDWLWHCLSVFLWIILMLHWINCDIVYLCSHVFFFSCCIGLIVTLFICVRMVLPHFALDWMWHCLSVFSWFFLMLRWIDCDIVYLCSYGSSSCCIGLIVTLFICVFMVLPHAAFDWLWHCLYMILWFSFMLHWIDCDIVILCFHGSSSCCLGLIVISFFLCSHGSSSWCVWLIVTLIIFVLMVLPRVALNWLWHCLSVFSWFFLMTHWIDCGIVYLSSHGSYSCCNGLIVTVFICVLMGLPYVAFDWLWHCIMVLPRVALDWLWHCFSQFLWFLLMLRWIDCDIVYLCFYGSFLCCIGLIVTLFICIFMVLPHVALDWLWHCLSVFSWVYLMLHWNDLTLFICVLIGLPHVALDWLWHCLSVFVWYFLMFYCIDCDIVFLCSYGSTSCCIELIVTLLICVLVPLPHVVFDYDIVNLCSFGSTLCCMGYIVALIICVLMVLPHVAWDWMWHS